MAKYFIDKESYFRGKKQPPQKVIIEIVKTLDSDYMLCIDKNKNEYRLNINEIYDDLNNPIKDARKRVNLTQKELSKYLNIPLRTIEDWETKKYTPREYVLQLALEKIFLLL